MLPVAVEPLDAPMTDDAPDVDWLDDGMSAAPDAPAVPDVMPDVPDAAPDAPELPGVAAGIAAELPLA